MKNKIFIVLTISVFILNGCAVVFQKGRRSDIEKIETLKEELQSLKHAREVLKSRLAEELKDQQVRLNMAEKGLVITFVAEVLFNSGKAKIREDSKSILDKVARILKEEVPDNNIGVEGHTDNVPIKHSGWDSNWELSAQRALSVLYYLESEGVNPKRLSAIGYGPYKPVASNDSEKGRQLNRRVEIVVLPKAMTKIEPEDTDTAYPEEELK
ncbi:MAG: OmpA family protein [Candidatus Omnitrophica bacterium]|nr:OmpA family protein [Candidatus Omnitrophota bacterium]MCF7878828.1 OmpA family protein [Candidatus Omnitrophota bacterium]MCF7893212.1 OmpA family protein [Candidatus Omnitrophota bacterium]